MVQIPSGAELHDAKPAFKMLCDESDAATRLLHLLASWQPSAATADPSRFPSRWSQYPLVERLLQYLGDPSATPVLELTRRPDSTLVDTDSSFLSEALQWLQAQKTTVGVRIDRCGDSQVWKLVIN